MERSIKDKNVCKGYVIFNRSIFSDCKCKIITASKNTLCPCRNCIVKTTCDATCNKFKEFSRLWNI